MLIGMGVDFGIHYYARVMDEYRAGEGLEEALARSVTHTGRAMVSAALTTICALLTLTAASFRGFVEFGVIASFGIALCLVSVLLVLPALLLTFERVWPTKRPSTPVEPPAALTAGGLKRSRMIGLGFMVIGLLGGGWAVMQWDDAQFEHDFRNLRGKKTGTGISYGAAVGKGKNTSPALILGDSVDQMRQVHEALAEKFTETEGGRGSYLKSFVTIQTYVPPEQGERAEIIREIHELVADPKLKRSKGKARTFIDRMKRLSDVEPFTAAEIPGWARRSLMEQDGTVGRLGFLYSNVKKWDAKDVQAFQDELGVIKVASGDVKVASSGFIIADVVSTVKSDAIRLMPIIFGVLVVVLLIDLRSISGALICLSTMGLALLWTVGGMIVFDIRLGLYNMINLPMILGTGIDGSIHLYHRYKELGGARLPEVLKTTGSAVVAASATTAAGFAGLLFVDHLGVRSIGTLATVGILATLAGVFLFMPGLLLWFGPKKT
jgi:predicted exporter